MNHDNVLPTRQTLLSRLRDWEDHRSWQEFFDTYWRLIYSVALKAGLSDTEAQEVVQETIISVARQMPGFRYNGKSGSFKGWLLHTTRWRIADQFRKRRPDQAGAQPCAESEAESGTQEIDRIPDPAAGIESAWDEAWERNLADAAIERVKGMADPKEFQIFDLHALREMPAEEVARRFRVSPARVYYLKYKLTRLIQREARRIEAQARGTAGR